MGKQKRKKDCSRGKREEQKKGNKDGEWFEREKKGRKKERGKRKTVKWLEMKKQKKDAHERTSLNGYDE